MDKLRKIYFSKVCSVKTNVYLYYNIKYFVSMMTQETFLQLLKDTSKREGVFKSFLEKYRNTFNTVISIQYSDEKYKNINIGEIFYKDFSKYVVDRLEKSEKTMSLDSWILILAKQRARNISQEVTKSYATYLLQTGGRENWDNFNVMLREVFAPTITKIVFKYFDHPRYKGLYKEVESSLLMQLYMSRVNNPAPIEKPIENIDAYVYRMLRNLAIKKKIREVISIELGLGSDDADFSKYDKSEEEEFDWEDNELDSTEVNKENNIHTKAEIDEGKDESQLNGEGNEGSTDDGGEADNAAKIKIERLLNLFPQKKRAQAYLIRRMILEDRTADEMVEELHCSKAVLYNRKRRAMLTLSFVSLQYNTQECKEQFIKYKEHLKNEYYKNVLNVFFFANISFEKMATSFKKNKEKFSEDLAYAFEEIADIINEKTKRKMVDRKMNKKIYVTDKDIEEYVEEEYRNEALSSSKH